jgi:glycosyltransferase involved in cell wall biosynthesis
MVRVCHITNVHSWNDTRIFYKECTTLVKSGYEVYLIAPNAEEGKHNDINILSVTNNSKSRIYRASVVAFKVFLKSIRTKARIFHFHDPELIWIGILLRILGKEVIFDVHENVKAQIQDKTWIKFKLIITTGYSFFEWIASKLFHIIIAEDSYEEIFLGKAKSITKVLNFPDLEIFSRMRNEKIGKENGILYVGLVSKTRGILEVLKALTILKERGFSFVFYCVGPITNELRQEIEESEAFKKVQDSVIIFGPLPVYEAYRLAEKSKVALSILHPIPNYTRSYSTKIFEYMAIGLPFIVSDFPIYSFVKEKHIGICVDPMDPFKIANSLEKILDGRIDVKAMIEAGKIAVETEYSWKSQSINLLNLYSTIDRS